jgi:hypothetical protein
MNQSALWVKFDQHHFVLGMEWRPLQPAEKLVRRTLSQLRREGMQWYVSSSLQHFVGTCRAIAQAPKPMHSAALHLAQQWSQDGLELFVFGMTQQRVAVVALNERSPVPGFDFIGDMAQAQSLIEEFEAIHEGSAIRRVGDLGLLANEEQLSASTVFDMPSSDSRLKKIPSLRAFAVAIALLALTLAGMAGVYQWQVRDRAQKLSNLPAPPPPDPNPAYNQSVNQRLSTLHLQGHALYQAWIQLISQLPLAHQGWVLTQVVCQGEQCLADWQRQYGSVADFHAQLPVRTHQAQQLPITNDALTQRIQTSHATPVQAGPRAYAALADLPGLALAFRNQSSWLQDMGLLGGRSLQVEKPPVWNAPAEGMVIKQALHKGAWSAELPLRLAADLLLPPNATVSELKTTLGAVYSLTGDYYARPDTP